MPVVASRARRFAHTQDRARRSGMRFQRGRRCPSRYVTGYRASCRARSRARILYRQVFRIAGHKLAGSDFGRVERGPGGAGPRDGPGTKSPGAILDVRGAAPAGRGPGMGRAQNHRERFWTCAARPRRGEAQGWAGHKIAGSDFGRAQRGPEGARPRDGPSNFPGAPVNPALTASSGFFDWTAARDFVPGGCCAGP